ncbi:FxSxx-COOH system tetratricopeptide repeat protein [Actinokineospora spheciospongiae]|uniref:FxSxx-COOH system tetratricopeptide repeat protein n=1 Tax=Actinokineospora spheciospongiae TaxID=909613 RepID=UPI000D70D305|nr:FxSxx-COOH system tetratricopeptide repeat protein [Actinokineospora spheciospongiae]PWW63571.1 Mrp family chromosome partitioning ATPase [Actinokineospora spheciospongiae]
MSGRREAVGQAAVTVFAAAAVRPGRADAVANLAVLLAAAGRRVLVLDWSTESPPVREFLDPFHTDTAEVPAALWAGLLAMVPAHARPAGVGPLERFTVPGLAGPVDLICTGTPGGLPDFVTATAGPAASGDLRGLLTESDYDDVLVLLPAGRDPDRLAAAAALGDLAVVVFAGGPRAVAAAVEVATGLRRAATVRVDVVALAAPFPAGDDPEQAAQARTDIHRAFAPITAEQADAPPVDGHLELPAWRHDDPFALLAVLVESPDTAPAVLAGHAALAEVVTGHGLPTADGVPAATRATYRRAFGLPTDGEPDRVLVAAAPAHRPWSDWVRDQLARAGARTRDLADPGDWLDPGAQVAPSVLAITAGDTDPPGLDALAGRGLRTHRFTPAPTPEGPVGPAGRRSATEHADRARSAMLRALGLVERRTDFAGPAPRLPGLAPARFGAPGLNPRLTPRDTDINALRDRFTRAGERRTIVTVTGAAGAGKSQLALAYAHRFAYDYDLVWWVPTHDRQRAFVALAGLAAGMGRAGGHQARAALRALATDPACRRFLLVFDDVPADDDLEDLLPEGGTGHILITTRSALDSTVELTGMVAGEAVALLTGAVPGLTAEHAAAVAEALDHRPYALELAGCWLRETVEALCSAGAAVAAAADHAAGDLVAELTRPADTHTPHRAHDPAGCRMTEHTLATLAETTLGRVTLLLVRMGAFLSAQGVALGLMRSRPLVAAVADLAADDALALDATRVDRALRLGERYGLLEVDWGNRARVHLGNTLQGIVADLMGPDEREATRATLLRCLARYAPAETADEAGSADRFAELQRHVLPSGALGSDDPQVRRWLVNQVRYLYLHRGEYGILDAALDIGAGVLDDWAARFGVDDPLRLRLAGQLANLARDLGHRRRALDLDRDTLARQRARPDSAGDLPTLATARGLGGDLRGLGRFADALVEDQVTWEGYVRELGEDHPQTRRAANNLAVSRHLSGDTEGALRVEEDNHRRRLRLFGEDDPDTWWSATNIGVYRRELRHPRAVEGLQIAWQKLRDLLGADARATVCAEWQFSAALRGTDAGRARNHARNARTVLRALLGETHPDTLAATLSFAHAQRRFGQDHAMALELALDAHAGFTAEVDLPPGHPFLALCELGLGQAEAHAGSHERAEERHRHALALLTDRLERVHPWTLAAAVDLGALLAETGRLDEAVRITTAARDDAVDYLGPGHPCAVDAGANLDLAARGVTTGWRLIDVDVPQT